MLKITAFRKGRPLKGLHVKNLRRLLSGDNIVWVDIERGTKKDFQFVAEKFKLHPLTVEDMRKLNSLPKVDVLQDRYMFVIFHELYYDRHVKKIKMNEMDFCVGKNFIITVHVPPMKSVETVRKKVLSTTYADLKPDHIMHKIMDLEVDGYMQMMDQLDEEIEDLEDRLIRGKANGNVLHLLSDHRREVTELRKIVGPQRDIINKLSRGEIPFITQHMLLYFRDIYDHMFRFYSSLEAHRDFVSSAFETYTSLQRTTTDRVIKQLTIISTIFLPLTFIVGIYGMNFRVMPELDYEYGYYIVLAAVTAIGVGMYLYFRKKKY